VAYDALKAREVRRFTDDDDHDDVDDDDFGDVDDDDDGDGDGGVGGGGDVLVLTRDDADDAAFADAVAAAVSRRKTTRVVRGVMALETLVQESL
jgi:hypothetical protein